MIDSAATPPLLPTTMRELRGPLGAILVCNAVGALGGAASAGAVRDWLPTLDQPRFQPPGWLFAPVWTVLYTSMGISVAAVRRTAGGSRALAERLFAIQLAVNLLWSFLFFNRRSPRPALIDAVLIVAAVGATIRAIWSVHRGAAPLLPYLAWTCFALLLNAELVRRNP